MSRAIKRRIEEIKGAAIAEEEEVETLQDILNQEDYFSYMRILDDKSFSVYVNDKVFEKVQNQIETGDTKSIWDLDQDGDNDIIDLMSASSNMGKINYDLDFEKIIIGNKYSSHWEFVYDGELSIKGTGIKRNNISGFMQKTQFDEEESQGTEFNSISFLLLSWDEDAAGNKTFYQELYHSLNITR